LAVLSGEEKAILDFERSWGVNGPKDRLIEGVLGLTSTRYYELLCEIVGNGAAIEYDPLTVKRVLRMIEGTAEAVVS
jgi:hypothetical protein